MDKLEQLRELRQYISRAREACAGSDVQEKDIFVSLLDKALKKSMDYEYDNLPILLVLIEKAALKIRDYGDRLPLDDGLCKILNGLDKQIKEIEYA